MSDRVTRPPPGPPRADGSKDGGWWHAPENGRILGDLSPLACAPRDVGRGFYSVRRNAGGRTVLTTYGKSTGSCVGPIEKKPLNHFYPGSGVLSFGTAGCNLGCTFCQNWSISRSKRVEGLSERATPEQVALGAESLGCKSVAFTDNDPVLWAEYAIDTPRACRERGIKAVAVTAGSIMPEARGPFFGEMDAANVDLKGFTEDFYQEYTLSHLGPVLETLR
jgi:pyruvate formate lyase activating enzyme